MTIIQNYPGLVLPQTWISGFVVSNSETTPDSELSISAGICRDSNNVMDICLGANNPNFEQQVVTAPLTLNAAGNGVNGLDQGTLAASKVYSVYAIGDSSYQKPTASLLSLQSNAYPLMPTGYDSYRLIGYAVTDGDADFFPFFTQGEYNTRKFIFDGFAITPVTAGTSTTYAPINLITIVPNINNLNVMLKFTFTPNAAGNVLSLQPAAAANAGPEITAQVASVVMTDVVEVFAQQVEISSVLSPAINYLVTASCSVGFAVEGFDFNV